MRLTTVGLFVLVSATFGAATQLPKFPQNWGVHEDQYAHIQFQKVEWHGHVYNDFTVAPHDGCQDPISPGARNCSAVAYVDDSGQKSTYDFYENEKSIRGLTYFVTPEQTCYCDMAILGRWLQSEIAESLTNPFMLKSGTLEKSGAVYKDKKVDVVRWTESLIFATSKMRIYVDEGGTSPVQYYTTFAEGNTSLGFNEVNMTDFTPGRPDPSVFIVPGKNMGTCPDYKCQSYSKKLKKGMHPIAAFPWHGNEKE